MYNCPNALSLWETVQYRFDTFYNVTVPHILELLGDSQTVCRSAKFRVLKSQNQGSFMAICCQHILCSMRDSNNHCFFNLNESDEVLTANCPMII